MTTSTKSTCDVPGRPGHVGNFWWQFVGTPSVDSCTKAEWLQEDSKKRKNSYSPIVALEQRSLHLVNRFKFLDDFSRFKLYIRYIQLNNSANQNRSMSELSAHLHWCERTYAQSQHFPVFWISGLKLHPHTHTSKRNIPRGYAKSFCPTETTFGVIDSSVGLTHGMSIMIEEPPNRAWGHHIRHI